MFNSCVLVFDLAIALIIILEYVSWTYQSFAPPTPMQARWKGYRRRLQIQSLIPHPQAKNFKRILWLL